ncbi:MAG: hypothetical protein IH984_01590 [Planctomycetes bacterium]|nr:hypothetical protein [Planctomycetota bacterium]
MTTIDITLPRVLSVDEQEELSKQLYWVTDTIRLIEGRENKPVMCVTFDGEPATEFAEELTTKAAQLIASFNVIPQKIVYERKSTRGNGCQTSYADLQAIGDIKVLGHGLHSYGGIIGKLFRALGELFLNEARTLGAEEFQFPALIRCDTLLKTGYVHSFPQHCHFVSHLDCCSSNLRAFRSEIDSDPDSIDIEIKKRQVAPEYALTPNVCYHCYEHFAGQRIPDNSSILVTAAQSCFRHEGRATEGLRRLREFTMREIICIGEEDSVLSQREQLLTMMKQLMDRLDLQGVIKSASDPFFCDDYDAKRMFQMGFELKQEMCASMPGEPSLAIASLNYHQDYFGRAFNIVDPSGEPAHSCCVGFGIDRWCAAILAQHGINHQAWPEPLLQLISHTT